MSLKNSILLLAIVLFTAISCNNAPSKKQAAAQVETHQHQHATTETKAAVAQTQAPQIGDLVPSNLVCMVNNQYMGVEQLVVDFEGKTYYGCCEMCQKRIPTEPKVRVAIDPYSQEEVNKAEAVIAVTGERGEVSYFANKENYKKYMAAR